MNRRPQLPRPENRAKVTHKSGDTDDIIAEVLAVYDESYSQTASLARQLQRGTVAATCRAIFDTIDGHTTYVLDPFRKQLIKTPARFWADGFGDCKSFAIFICSCLRCLGIPHCFRFAGYAAGTTDPTHVYAVAYDEQGNEIPVDPVYKENGVGQFGKEVKYVFKRDMRGTTEIARLSGIGYPGYNAEITRLPETNITRQQQDLLVALNILQMYESAARKQSKWRELKVTLDRIDVALLALMAYQSGYPKSTVSPEQLLSALWLMVEGGRFDLSASTSEENREQFRTQAFSDMLVLGGSIASPDPEAYRKLYALTSGELVASLSGIGSATDVPSDNAEFTAAYRKNFRSAKSQQDVAEVQKKLRDSAEYFMYCFIPEAELTQYPEAVTTKRRAHESYIGDIEKSGCMTRAQVMATLNAQLTDRWGSPAIFLAGVKNGNIPVESAAVGLAEWITAVLLPIILAVIAGLFALIEKWMGGSSSDYDFEATAPDASDGFIYNNVNPSFGTGGNDLTRTGSTLSKFLPVVLIGAALLLPDGKKKNKS